MNDTEIAKDLDGGDYDTLEFEELEDKKKISIIPSLPEDSINLFDDLQIDYYKNNNIVKEALKYIKLRKLDIAINNPDALYISLKDPVHKNRLIIPFKDNCGKILWYQSRKIFDWDEKPRYLSKVNSEKTISGLDKITEQYPYVFLFEGPIDSFFVKNGISVGGINEGRINLASKQKEQMTSLHFFDKIWVLDSQWKDKTARDKTLTLLEQGEEVFIWPKNIGTKYKDLNELCVDNNLNQISPTYIKNNSIQGKDAVIKFKLIFVN
jgi:hypothetical protein